MGSLFFVCYRVCYKEWGSVVVSFLGVGVRVFLILIESRKCWQKNKKVRSEEST